MGLARGDNRSYSDSDADSPRMLPGVLSHVLHIESKTREIKLLGSGTGCFYVGSFVISLFKYACKRYGREGHHEY